MPQPITITAIASASALGASSEKVWQHYRDGVPLFSRLDGDIVSKVSSEIETEVQNLQQQKDRYKNLDRSVLLALVAAKKCANAFKFQQKNIGVNIGSSRGATSLFETYYQDFQQHGKVSPFASPTTTLGNISSWVAQDLGLDGVAIDHSVTCSTAMHAVLNGIAWLHAGMADTFLVGGSEAALTPFTIAQMKALKRYSDTRKRCF